MAQPSRILGGSNATSVDGMAAFGALLLALAEGFLSHRALRKLKIEQMSRRESERRAYQLPVSSLKNLFWAIASGVPLLAIISLQSLIKYQVVATPVIRAVFLIHRIIMVSLGLMMGRILSSQISRVPFIGAYFEQIWLLMSIYLIVQGMCVCIEHAGREVIGLDLGMWKYLAREVPFLLTTVMIEILCSICIFIQASHLTYESSLVRRAFRSISTRATARDELHSLEIENLATATTFLPVDHRKHVMYIASAFVIGWFSTIAYFYYKAVGDIHEMNAETNERSEQLALQSVLCDLPPMTLTEMRLVFFHFYLSLPLVWLLCVVSSPSPHLLMN
mmetsp:Transcript_6044/g.8382  ORF Transcript_6044/g.8382 Transcript_6044/m.8382 type:complete len:334 (-) Transcript_6044:44-1045(-)